MTVSTLLQHATLGKSDHSGTSAPLLGGPFAMPSGLGWDTTDFPLTVQKMTYLPGGLRAVGTVSQTAAGFFDAVSTARTAPGATFYVSVDSGSDANNGLTVGTAVRSIGKAIVLANAAGVPSTIFVAHGSEYPNANNIWFSGLGVPTVDIAFIATGGRVINGTFDTFAAPTRDATQTNTYSYAVTNVDRVCDVVNHNRYGNFTDLANVSTAALCNATPNSWALVSGTLYINRADQAAVTHFNTRVYRSGQQCLRLTPQVNVYFGGQNPGDGFDFEGAGTVGVLDLRIAAPGATRHVAAFANCSFKYGGGIVNTVARGASVDSWQGLAVFENCRADENYTDGFNCHNTNGAAAPHLLTINCTGFNNGRNANQSNNGWTSHENVAGIDVCGYYEGNHGGTCRSINSSKSWLVGTSVKDDRGDIMFGGALPPTAFQTDDTAIYWCDSVRLDMPASSRGFVGNSVIHVRNRFASALPDVGTVDIY